jgi:hypothetical protein
MLIAAIAAIAISAPFISSARAQCSTADKCTAQECGTRQNNVHPTCDVPRSCGSIAATSANRAELQRRLQLNQNCLAARTNVSQCFSNADTCHDQQFIDIRSSIQAYENKLKSIPGS